MENQAVGDQGRIPNSLEITAYAESALKGQAIYQAVAGVAIGVALASQAIPVKANASASKNASLLEPGPFAGESISARSSSQRFTTAERAQINRIGNETGCHSCGTTIPGTKSGNFVPDHQPPSALNTTNQSQVLYPQCIDCSRAQGLEIIKALRGH